MNNHHLLTSVNSKVYFLIAITESKPTETSHSFGPLSQRRATNELVRDASALLRGDLLVIMVNVLSSSPTRECSSWISWSKIEFYFWTLFPLSAMMILTFLSYLGQIITSSHVQKLSCTIFVLTFCHNIKFCARGNAFILLSCPLSKFMFCPFSLF